MKIVRINSQEALAESGGLTRTVGLQLIRNIKVGDYVIVHAGFAIEKLDKKYARETLELLKKIGTPQ